MTKIVVCRTRQEVRGNKDWSDQSSIQKWRFKANIRVRKSSEEPRESSIWWGGRFSTSYVFYH